MTKANSGTLTLSGANTYSGVTLVSAGTLIGTSTSLQGAINNNSAVIFDQAASGSYGGSMSGTGTLTKANSGTLTLTASNSYTGNTTVQTGTLILGTTGSLQFVIGGSGTNNAVNGTGTTTMNGQFNFDLTGASTNTNSTWTIVANTLTNSYGANFLVNGFTGAGGSWTNTTNGVRYVFSESSGTLSVQAINNPTPVDPFQDWVAYWQATKPDFVQTAGTDDPDGDGYSNSAEFAFGGDPTSSSMSQWVVKLVGTQAQFEFVALKSPSTTTYYVESKSDLGNPSTAWQVENPEILDSLDQTGIIDTTKYIRRSFFVPILDKRFYHIRAVTTP